MEKVAEFSIDFLQCLDPAGKVVTNPLPQFAQDDNELLEAYKEMLFVRVFDDKAVKLQRTGKLGTYASCLGHEAAHVAIGRAMKQEDCFAPMYREYGAQMHRGVKPREIFLYWGGDERGNDFSGPKHDFAWCVPIATQCLYAAGAAMAYKLRGEKRCAVSVVGDGGTSKTDFYAAVNSAGAYDLPLVLVVVNNQWAISVPRHKQTGAETLAQKGIASGLHCLQVDGNDYIAMRHAMDEALERARNGQGATVIEAVTYRLSDHTTADDARRYRDDDEVQEGWKKEPMIRLRKYLTDKGLWDEAQEKAFIDKTSLFIDDEVNAYLDLKTQEPSAMFDYLYAELPEDLASQRAEVMGEK